MIQFDDPRLKQLVLEIMNLLKEERSPISFGILDGDHNITVNIVRTHAPLRTRPSVSTRHSGP